METDQVINFLKNNVTLFKEFDDQNLATITIEKGVVCALRHIHMSPEEALKYGLKDRYIVKVRVDGNRETVFGDVLIRVHPNFKLAMHIDTDEANAANIKTGTIGFIEGIQNFN